jgi:hypothetical protein
VLQNEGQNGMLKVRHDEVFVRWQGRQDDVRSGKPEGLMAIMPIGAMMKQGNKPAASGSNKTVRGAKTMASGGRINGSAKRGHTKGKMC